VSEYTENGKSFDTTFERMLQSQKLTECRADFIVTGDDIQDSNAAAVLRKEHPRFTTSGRSHRTRRGDTTFTTSKYVSRLISKDRII